mgnify:CR=1 FL=1
MPAPVSSLPGINACLNASAAVLLTAGWLLIRARKIEAHRLCLLAALFCSTVFLACYLYYHYQVGSVRYQGPHRPLYLSILLTHTVLAIVNLPLILRSFFLAWKQRFEEHRRIARWAMPIWLYVSVTGVVVYSMLYGNPAIEYFQVDACLDKGGCWDSVDRVCRRDEPNAQELCDRAAP